MTTPLLKEQDLAKLINMTLATIRKWRVYGGGPKFLKIGTSVRYRMEDIQAWLNGTVQDSNDAHQEAA